MVKVFINKGDITELAVDVIVNAANSSLLGGGGVDGAIHAKGGSSILEECKVIANQIGSLPKGEAVITNAGNLKAKKIIHTAGPRWNFGRKNEHQLLENCYINCLKLAEEINATSIAFPNISTGIYRFPKDEACKIALGIISRFKYNKIKEVFIVSYDEENYSLYKEHCS